MKKFIFFSLFVAGLFVAPVFVFAATGGWFANRFAPKPEVAVLSFLQEVKRGNIDNALKSVLSFRRGDFLKVLEPLKKDSVAFDIDYSVDAVSFEGNAAKVAVKIPVKDVKIESIEQFELAMGIVKREVHSWSFYLEFLKASYEFAKEFGKTLEGSSFVVKMQAAKMQPNFDQWDYFLVKNGSWLRGYRWEIVDAPEFIGFAQGISVTNKVMRDISSLVPLQGRSEFSPRDKERIYNLKELQLAMELYYDKNGAYPAALTLLEGEGYIRKIPSDPSTGASFFYATPQERNISTYHIGVKLEEIDNSALRTDADFNSRARGYRNGFDGSDPMYDITP